eukprot:726789-Rhodomonas_salina.1
MVGGGAKKWDLVKVIVDGFEALNEFFSEGDNARVVDQLAPGTKSLGFVQRNQYESCVAVARAERYCPLPGAVLGTAQGTGLRT